MSYDSDGGGSGNITHVITLDKLLNFAQILIVDIQEFRFGKCFAITSTGKHYRTH